MDEADPPEGRAGAPQTCSVSAMGNLVERGLDSSRLCAPFFSSPKGVFLDKVSLLHCPILEGPPNAPGYWQH